MIFSSVLTIMYHRSNILEKIGDWTIDGRSH